MTASDTFNVVMTTGNDATLDKVTFVLLLSVIVGEALAVVVVAATPVAPDEVMGATELAIYAFNPLVIVVIAPPNGQPTNWTRKTHAENGM